MGAVEEINGLTPEQCAVVQASDGPLLVIARAGSGKTRSLVHRISWKIAQGLDPSRIGLFTFTNRAAQNMLAQVQDAVGPRARHMLAGTFHSAALVVLKRYADCLGFTPEFSILTRDDQKQIVTQIVTEIDFANKSRLPKVDVLLAMFSRSLNTLQPIDVVLRQRFLRFLPIAEPIGEIGLRFMRKKRAINSMDFDDMLFYWRTLLHEHEEVREELAERYELILVDEYQDTNRLQNEIIFTLAQKHQNLTVVGDDAQSIYGFRGADVGNMRRFLEQWPSAQRLGLSKNFRSTPQILSTANLILDKGVSTFELPLHSMCPQGELPSVVACKSMFHQAQWVTNQARALHNAGCPWHEMAVLYRAHHHAMELQLELLKQEVPFAVRSGLRFFEQAHIRDVVAHLRYLLNPKDEAAFIRAIRLREGIGPKLAQKIWLGTYRNNQVSQFEQLIAKLKSLSSQPKVSLLIEAILSDFYEDYVFKQFVNAEQRLTDIRRLSEFTNLQEMSLLTDVTDVGEHSGKRDQLLLSSVHQAKGLEWRHVWVIGLNEGSFPSEMALREEGGLLEERRLFYVATTRAKQMLWLSYCSSLQRSRFIDELAIDGDTSSVVQNWVLEDTYENAYR